MSIKDLPIYTSAIFTVGDLTLLMLTMYAEMGLRAFQKKNRLDWSSDALSTLG